MIQQLNENTAENNKVLNKIHIIEQQLQNYGFIQKIYGLASNYLFFFDLHKIVNQTITKQIRKLCILFFKFLLYRIVRQEEGKYQKQKVLSQGQRNSLKKFNSSNYGQYDRMNKNRANTTLQGLNKKKENNIKTQSFVHYSQKQNSINQKDQQKQIQKILDKLVRLNNQIKQAYFELVQSNKNRVTNVEIICFLIGIISPNVLQHFINLFQKQVPQYKKVSKNQENQQHYSIQQQVYVVLTYQTLGSLISPNSFKYLKRKYIKQTIIQTFRRQQYTELLKSLKHIKQNLKSQKNIKVMLGKRRKNTFKALSIQKFDPEVDLTKQNFKQFIKQSLKIKHDLNHEIRSLPKQQSLSNKQPNTFYPTSNNYKSYEKISIPKQNLFLKHSPSIKLTLNLKGQKKSGGVRKINKIKNTFYKLVSKQQQKQSNFLKIKSQRSSYKFSRIANENNHTQISKIRGTNKNSMQFMKNQILRFQNEAKKDLQTIEQFKPSMSSKQSKYDCISHDFRHRYPLYKIQNLQSTFLRSNGSKAISNKKQLKMRLSIKQKEELWHPMYNIRSQSIPTTAQKSIQSSIQYKLSKKSDKLRKIQHLFEQDCKKRIQNA